MIVRVIVAILSECENDRDDSPLPLACGQVSTSHTLFKACYKRGVKSIGVHLELLGGPLAEMQTLVK